MAQKVLVSLVDDIDGTAAEATMTFALDGIAYEIDLNGKNRLAFEKAMDKYISHARKAGRASSIKGAAPKRARAPKEDTTAIREWAAANGHVVSERGRISAAVQDAYKAAHA